MTTTLPDTPPCDSSEFVDQPLPRAGAALITASNAFSGESVGRSWYHAVSTAVILAASWTGVVLSPWLGLQIGLAVLTGLLIIRMFVIYHDHQHGAILRNSKLGSLFMGFFGVLFLAPPSIWRASHNYHHRNNSKLSESHVGSYPVMTTDEWAEASWSTKAFYRFVRHPATISLSYVFAFFWSMALEPFLRRPLTHWDGLLSVLVHIGMSIGFYALGGWPLLLLAQTIPHVIASALGGYLFYAQHNFPDVAFTLDEDWNYHDAALKSSSCMKLNPIMHWFTANIGYHHIHHLNARIPFYRLRETMEALPELQAPATTSLKLGDIRRCLRLALWDADAKRMVGFNGV